MAEEKSMECPFTWGINHDYVMKYRNLDSKLKDKLVSQYLFKPLIDSITRVYMLIIKEEFESAETELNDILNLWNNSDQRKLCLDRGISEKVLEHIIKSTEYRVYIELSRNGAAEKILEGLQDSAELKSEEELGTIYGCKSMSCYRFENFENATLLAREAVRINPECSAWQYELGRNLWKTRHDLGVRTPSDEEIESLVKSYKSSGNPHYGIKAAQILKEAEMYYERKMSDDILRRIFETIQPDIMGRLADCFMKKNDKRRAEECIDYLGFKTPVDSAYLALLERYNRKYNKRFKSYEVAAEFHEQASGSENSSDMQ